MKFFVIIIALVILLIIAHCQPDVSHKTPKGYEKHVGQWGNIDSVIMYGNNYELDSVKIFYKESNKDLRR